MADQQKLDELEQSIIDLKIRLERVEEFLISFPNPYRFIHKKTPSFPVNPSDANSFFLRRS